MNDISEETKNREEDLFFSDDCGNLYDTYLSLHDITLKRPKDEFLFDLVLSISKEEFPIKDYPECFKEETNGIHLDLAKLLGLVDRLQSQVLTFVLKGKKESVTTRVVFLNRYVLLKDPRKETNRGHMSVLLNTLVLDYVYHKDKLTSNLVVNLDGKKLYFLLEGGKQDGRE